MNSFNELKPFSVYFEEEQPESNDIIIKLEEAIQKFMSSGEYKAAAIGFDVLFKSPNIPLGEDAIEIRIFHSKHTFKRVFKYFKSGKEYKFEEINT